jgi:hypothetical protein
MPPIKLTALKSVFSYFKMNTARRTALDHLLANLSAERLLPETHIEFRCNAQIVDGTSMATCSGE